MADVEPPRRRRRLLKVALAGVVLIGVIALVLPILGASFARKLLIGRLEDALEARATLDELAFGMSGWAALTGLGLEDLEGRAVLELDRADLSVRLIPMFRGRFEGEAVLDGLVVHVRRDGEGRWNLATLPREGPGQVGSGEGTGAEGGDVLPDVHGNLVVRHGRVVVHGEEAQTELRELELDVVLDGPEEPAAFHLTTLVEGPTGPGGRITVDGSTALSPDASGVPPASFALSLDGLLLEALEPALALALDLEEGLHRDTIDLKAELHLADGDLAIERLDVTSSMVRGSAHGTIAGLVAPDGASEGPRFEGLAGEFAYVPDQVAPLVEPWLPGKLSGSEEETITFELSGAVGDQDLASMLAATKGWATVGLGRFETEGFDTSGDVRLEMEGGVAVLLGTIGANGGTMRLKAAADLRGAEDSASWVEVNMDAVRANAELAPLLGRVHPLLGAADALKASDLGGLIACTLRLAYDGPLDLAALPASWAEVPKEHISGTGTLALTDMVLAGSPLLDRMLTELGASPGQPIDLAPVEFEIRGGRLQYHKPWQWTIAGAKTTFSGSVGLDETLALRWSVPITEDLVRKHGFLKPLLGESLVVPLEGTTRKPKLRIEDALSDLAKSALTTAAKDRVEDELGGLGGIEDVGDVAEKVGDLLGGKAQEGGEDAATLYERAGKLWDEGKKQEAGALYERIQKEFKLSAIYLLHKDKIKKRAKEAP